MSCCNHDCDSGRTCPIRVAAAARNTASPLATDNSDGSTAHSEDLHDDTGLLICQGLALVVFVVSVVFYALL